jgi:L-asparaginase
MTVVVISTGGTIASTEDDDGATPSLTGSDLVEAIPGVAAEAEIQILDFATIPSPQFTVSRMYDLVTTIRDVAADDDVEGIVVTQGTDTLEEVSYFVDLCYDGDVPIVFTGAMRHPSLPSPDGPINLLASVRVAASDRANEFGTLVAFNDRVYPARDVTKTHSMNVDTFRSPEFGPLGTVDEDRVTWRRELSTSDVTYDLDPAALTNDVVAVTVTADMPVGRLADADDAAAVCLATMGAGHVPETLVDPLADLRAADVPVVATTRSPEGRLARNTYGFRGSESTLRDLGCQFSDLNLQKTRIKTIVALAAGEFDAAFERPGPL